MPEIAIRRAETQDDFDAARALGRAWVEWPLRTFPEERENIFQKFDPVEYAQTLRDLPVIHARPKGAVLLALLDGAAVGCVMYDEMEPGVAEVHRLFVAEAGRGHGLGRALLTTMFAHMKSDGYATVRFSSARLLTHARALYEAVGIHDSPVPPGLPDFVYFMGRPL